LGKCKHFCEDYPTKPFTGSNLVKYYAMGYRQCLKCDVSIKIPLTELFCPCCGTRLRNKVKSKGKYQKWLENNYLNQSPREVTEVKMRNTPKIETKRNYYINRDNECFDIHEKGIIEEKYKDEYIEELGIIVRKKIEVITTV
jgi:uncharacterized Zn finger protein (UPF0148 family)